MHHQGCERAAAEFFRGGLKAAPDQLAAIQGRLERIAQCACRRDALRLRAHQCLRPGEARLAESAGQRYRVIPLDEVDVPHRAVIELAAIIGHVLQDVQRRFLVQDGGIQPLALYIVPSRLTVGEGNQAFAAAPGIDEGSIDVDVIGAAVRERHIAENRRERHVFDSGGSSS